MAIWLSGRKIMSAIAWKHLNVSFGLAVLAVVFIFTVILIFKEMTVMSSYKLLVERF